MPQGSADRNRSRGALIVFCFLALPLFAQDAASVALLVTEPTSTEAAEKDAGAAREAMRALVILGTDEDVAFAASHRSRFPASIDGDFAEAVGRIGAPRAVSLYLQHAAGTRDPAPAIDLTLWGRTSMANGTASRLMGAGDARAFGALLHRAAESKVILEPGILIAALGSKPAIAGDAIWYLVEVYAADPAQFPDVLREPATAAREGASPSEAFGREVFRRILGAKFVEKKEHLAWRRESRAVPRSPDVQRFLTLGELAALDRDPPARRPHSTHRVTAVRKPEFMLPIELPEGLAEANLKKTKCSDAWIGVAKATVDRAGRVQTLDLGNVGARGGCVKALEAMLRLSLADPVTITSPLETTNLLVVKPRGRSVCFDDDPISDVVSPRYLMRVGNDVTVPKVVHREEPVFPRNVRETMKGGNVVIIGRSSPGADAFAMSTSCSNRRSPS